MASDWVFEGKVFLGERERERERKIAGFQTRGEHAILLE